MAMTGYSAQNSYKLEQYYKVDTMQWVNGTFALEHLTLNNRNCQGISDMLHCAGYKRLFSKWVTSETVAQRYPFIPSLVSMLTYFRITSIIQLVAMLW